MLVMLGALIAQVRTNPYTTTALNAIEFCSLCFTVLIMVCGMAFRVVRTTCSCAWICSVPQTHRIAMQWTQENLDTLRSFESGDKLDLKGSRSVMCTDEARLEYESDPDCQNIECQQMNRCGSVSKFLTDFCIGLVCVMALVSFATVSQKYSYHRMIVNSDVH